MPVFEILADFRHLDDFIVEIYNFHAGAHGTSPRCARCRPFCQPNIATGSLSQLRAREEKRGHRFIGINVMVGHLPIPQRSSNGSGRYAGAENHP